MLENKIAIVDYDVGNTLSIKRCLEKLDYKSQLIKNPEDLEYFDMIILPGVGRFDYVMAKLNDTGFSDKIISISKNKVKILGICVGMQVMFETSEESEKTKGLCLIKGNVKKIISNETYKAPHIGWSKVYSKESSNLQNYKYFYFVHSYASVPKNDNIISSTAKYGPNIICASIRMGNLYGTQFHPEKSGKDGINYLKYFIND